MRCHDKVEIIPAYWITCADMKLVDFFVVCFEGFKDVLKARDRNQIFWSI